MINIDPQNVHSFESAMGELSRLIEQLQKAGLSRIDAYDAAYAAYEAYGLGYNRATKVWGVVQEVLDEG